MPSFSSESYPLQVGEKNRFSSGSSGSQTKTSRHFSNEHTIPSNMDSYYCDDDDDDTASESTMKVKPRQTAELIKPTSRRSSAVSGRLADAKSASTTTLVGREADEQQQRVLRRYHYRHPHHQQDEAPSAAPSPATSSDELAPRRSVVVIDLKTNVIVRPTLPAPISKSSPFPLKS